MQVQITNGARLAAARKVVGFSLTEAATQLGTNPQKLMQMEARSGVNLSTDFVEQVAGLYGRGPDFFMERPLPEVFPISQRAARLTPEQYEAVEAKVSIELERQLEIESYFHDGELNYKSFPAGFPVYVSNPAEAAAAADALRNVMSLSMIAPIPNVAKFCEHKGFRVAVVDFPYPVFDALAFISDDEYRLPIIATQRGIPGDIQRWAMIRELAFYLLAEPTDAMSKHFAGAFLFPDEAIYENLGYKRVDFEVSELLYYKRVFGISLRHIVTRMATVGVIDREIYDALLALIEELGWNRRKPVILPFEDPDRTLLLAMRLHAEERISTRLACSLLELSEDQWFKMLGYAD